MLGYCNWIPKQLDTAIKSTVKCLLKFLQMQVITRLPLSVLLPLLKRETQLCHTNYESEQSSVLHFEDSDLASFCSLLLSSWLHVSP